MRRIRPKTPQIGRRWEETAQVTHLYTLSAEPVRRRWVVDASRLSDSQLNRIAANLARQRYGRARWMGKAAEMVATMRDTFTVSADEWEPE